MNELIPPNWSTQEKALAGTVERVSRVPLKIREVWSPQECPIDLLPWLAWALHVDSWDAAWPEQKKRDVVAASIEVHRQKGTIAALKRALQALGYEVHIDERTGQAYTFRVQVDVSQGGATEALFTEVERITLETKNVRSQLLGVDALLSTESEISVSAVTVTGDDTFVLPMMVRELATASGLYVGIVEQSIDTARIFPVFAAMLESEGTYTVAGMASFQFRL